MGEIDVDITQEHLYIQYIEDLMIILWVIVVTSVYLGNGEILLTVN